MYFRQEINFKPDEVLVYLRKSRSDDPTLTVEEVLAKHETMLDEWAVKNLGAKVPDKNKYREVVSGETLADRPEIQTVLRMIESPRYKAVLIVDVQRLSRGDLEDAGRLIKLFRYTNTIILTLGRSYDIRDEYDRENLERELKRGNEYLEYNKKIMNNGKLLSVSQGNYIGNAPPYGYDKTTVVVDKRKCPTLKIKEDEADVVRMIFDMYVNKGMGAHRIAYTLHSMGIKTARDKQWENSAIINILKNVHYIGKVKWQWRKNVYVVEGGEVRKTRPRASVDEALTFDGKQPAIISEELFYAAQERLGTAPKIPPGKELVNPFAGLIFCKKCGKGLTYQVYKHEDGSERSPSRYVCRFQRRCQTGSCQCNDITERVTEILKSCIEDFEIRMKEDNTDVLAFHKRLVENLEKQMEDINARELSQWEAQSDPDPSKRMPAEIFQKLNEKLLKEKEEVQEALCKAYDSAPEAINYEERIARFTEALNALNDDEVSPQVKNELLKACIERIEYSREKPQRILSQRKARIRDENGELAPPMKAGACWTEPPIELDVTLKV